MLQKNFKILSAVFLSLLLAGTYIIFSSRVTAKTPCEELVGSETCRKIGQMLIIGFGGFGQNENGVILWNDEDSAEFKENSQVAKHIANNHVGGIILFSQPIRDIKTGQIIRDRNVKNQKQVAKLNQDLLEYNNKIREKQMLPSIPLFISTDQEGGTVDKLPATQGFPVRTILPQALGAKYETLVDDSTTKPNIITETYKRESRIS